MVYDPSFVFYKKTRSIFLFDFYGDFFNTAKAPKNAEEQSFSTKIVVIVYIFIHTGMWKTQKPKTP